MGLLEKGEGTVDSPLVSIGIPTFNSAKYLRQCLDSIASQTYRNLEVLISDNASTDDTVSIVKEYSERFGFRIHVNPRNIGAGENFNLLIGMATGKYVAIYHSDDVYESTIVEESVGVLNGDPEIALVGTMGYQIDDRGRRFGELKLNKKIKGLKTSKYTFDQALTGVVSRWWFFVTPSIMVRKTVLEELGVFETRRYGSCGDYELWLRIANRYPVGIIDKKLIHVRSHGGQGTELEVRKSLKIPDIVLVLREYKNHARGKQARDLCERCIDGNILQFGRRQNYRGEYGASDETLTGVRLLRHMPQKQLIRLFNRLKISIKNRKPQRSVDGVDA